MQTVRFIKSFSKGQVTIPKDIRDTLGIVNEFWLKVYVDDGKIIAEPVEREINKAAWRKNLLQIKQVSINTQEIVKNRQEVERQIKDRAL